MRIFDLTSVSEFTGDFIVYRSLQAVDERLPRLAELRQDLGIEAGPAPRKSEPDYARLVAALLRRARSLGGCRTPLRSLIFIGDTQLLDGTAFSNLCLAGGWKGICFIGDETGDLPAVRTSNVGTEQLLFLSNRWAFLDGELADEMGIPSFPEAVQAQGIVIDEDTALVIDLDKTALGARGRNAGVIDAARVQAVHETVAELLGEAFDPQSFRQAYDLLNQPAFHPFTADNQDYLAYTCLMLGGGMLELARLVEEIQNGQIRSFRQFIEWIEQRRQGLPPSLEKVHREIWRNVQAGDPTPFKAFRYNEYRITTDRMGWVREAAEAGKLLKEEIVLTQEVRQLAQRWANEGALVFGLSDKPDEASLPTPELSAQGRQALHRTLTHAVGA